MSRLNEVVWDKYNQEQKFNKPLVESLTVTFLTKHSAEQMARTRQKSTGKIDLRRVKYYKTSEDIFGQKTITPNGKNHGMFILLDVSESMRSMLHDTVQQIINLIKFCQRVNIPFELYSFTSGGGMTSNLILSHIISSSRKKNEVDEDLMKLWMFSHIPSQSGMTMSGTPTIDALSAIGPKVKKFKMANGLDVANFILVTDGEHNMTSFDPTAETIVDNKLTKTRKKLTSGNMEVDYRYRSYSNDVFAYVVSELKDALKLNMLWFFIGRERGLEGSIETFTTNISDQGFTKSKSFKDDGFVMFEKFYGFDKTFFVSSSKMFNYWKKAEDPVVNKQSGYQEYLGETLTNSKFKRIFGVQIANSIIQNMFY